MKHYMGAVHWRHAREGPILDVGCGSGHDMSVLARLGVDEVIGVDRSDVMLDEARRRTAAPLARSLAEHLPFRDGSFAGCWIERVLMHVEDPDAVVAEVVRCLQPGAVLTVFEPDWSSLTVNGRRVPAGWATVAKHPSVGSEVGGLLRRHGCFIRDRVEERSWWTFQQFESITNLAVARATASEAPAVQSWIDDVRSSAYRGEFDAEMVKVLWVATAAG